ncbi:MAG: LysE family translocator [Halocynthiibacter sp.]
MSYENLLVLLGLAFTAAFTPGPNNALVASSGANFGYRRTIPHILGIAAGFSFMVFVVGFILGTAFEQSRILREVLRWGGAAVLFWIAWKIAVSGGLGRSPDSARPFRFYEAAAFQWINPKAWVMAIAIPAQFITGEAPLGAALAVAAVFLAVGFCSSSSWALVGRALTRWINTKSRMRWFNMAMGAMIATLVVLLLLE